MIKIGNNIFPIFYNTLSSIQKCFRVLTNLSAQRQNAAYLVDVLPHLPSWLHLAPHQKTILYYHKLLSRLPTSQAHVAAGIEAILSVDGVYDNRVECV